MTSKDTCVPCGRDADPCSATRPPGICTMGEPCPVVPVTTPVKLAPMVVAVKGAFRLGSGKLDPACGGVVETTFKPN